VATAADALYGAPMHEASGPPTSVVLTERQFWGLFAAGWLTYAGLLSFAFLFQGEAVGKSLLTVVANLTPLVVPAAVLGYHRKRLLAPRASLAAFIGHKIAVGLAYAVAVTAVGGLVVLMLPEVPMTEIGNSPQAIVAVLMLTGLFLYIPLMAFLVFADSLDRIQESRTLASREAVLRAQAEAKAVRAQFNPHFVFNTLHSLMLLVRKDPDTAEQAIEDVAGLIRYASTLQRQEIDQVSLDKELAFAKRYLALEKLRLADRLAVSWDVDEGVQDVLVPAFSVQTLLENAIKHGIAPKTDGGSVRIRATAASGTFEMVVADDGLGADPAAVAANGGSGLQLLGHRLEAAYGGEATLEWATRPGGGFRATLRIPARRAAQVMGDRDLGGEPPDDADGARPPDGGDRRTAPQGGGGA